MIVREQRYAEEALQEKAAKEQRKALEKLRENNPEQPIDAGSAEPLAPNSTTPGSSPAATTNTATTPEPAAATEEKPIDD
jgi:hypothetical protein